MTPRITAVLFDLGDTLWHFPSMPPVEVIRSETVGRLSRLLKSWGEEVTDERYYLGRDIRLAVEEETSRAFHGDSLDPGYPELCRRVAARNGLRLTPEQGEELWEAWNLGGQFLGRTLFPGVLETLRWLKERGFRLGSLTNRGYGGPRFQQEMRNLGLAETPPEPSQGIQDVWIEGTTDDLPPRFQASRSSSPCSGLSFRP